MSNIDCLPYFAQGTVMPGFKRGSKDLGIPTANFPNDVVDNLPETLKCGVYYGWASIDGRVGVHKMVLSVGWNVFYGNDIKTMETHIIKQYDEDFYGENLRVVILGYIRQMTNFDSLDALITAIHNDIRISKEELMKPKKFAFKSDPFFVSADLLPAEEKSIQFPNESDFSKGLHQEDNGAFQTEEPHKSVNSSCNGSAFSTSKHISEESVISTDRIAQPLNGTINFSDNSGEKGTLS